MIEIGTAPAWLPRRVESDMHQFRQQLGWVTLQQLRRKEDLLPGNDFTVVMFLHVLPPRSPPPQKKPCFSGLLLPLLINGKYNAHAKFFFLNSFAYFHFMHMSVLPSCMSMHLLCTWYPRRPEEGIGSPGAGVTDCCEPSM